MPPDRGFSGWAKVDAVAPTSSTTAMSATMRDRVMGCLSLAQAAAQPGICDISYGVAEQVQREHGEADRHAGEEDEPGCRVHGLGSGGQHRAPRRLVGRRAHPEE